MYRSPLFVLLLTIQQDDLSMTEPWFSIPSDPNPATTEIIDIELGRNESGVNVFTMNKSAFRADYNSPILLLSKAGNNSYPDSPEWNVYNFGSNSSIRIVITNGGPIAHPMHLHGHNFFVEKVGNSGEVWDGSVTRQSNPQRRDTQILPAGGFLVLQITADNPGIWPLHCHIAWHVSAGLYVTIMERPDDIANLRIPRTMAQTCHDWAKFANTTVVDQIDSGL
jgi:FtsP/CotA-like multicopper oxidase with cupredoxin domain